MQSSVGRSALGNYSCTTGQEVSDPGAHEGRCVRVNQLLVQDVRADDVKHRAVILKKHPDTGSWELQFSLKLRVKL